MRIYRETYNDRNGQKQTAIRWYIDFTDHLNRRHKLPAFTDKRQSEALCRQIEALIASKSGTGLSVELQKWVNTLPTTLLKNLAKWGLLDNCRIEGGKPLKEHIEDWRTSLLNSGVCEQYVGQVYGAVKEHFQECGFNYFNDISASKLQNQIASLKRRVGRKVCGEATATTKNYHIRYCKQFCKWIYQDGRASQNPLEHIKKFADTGGKKRAAFEPEELRGLLTYTKASKKIYGLSGYQRFILYRFASETGFRTAEIQALKVKDFDFVNGIVTLSGEHTKNSKDAAIPLKNETAAILKEYFSGKMSNVQAFKLPYVGNLAAMIRKDLKAAEITIDPDRGSVCFYSTRHSFGSMLAASGVHPKTAQELMRHSDINLTMSRYTHSYRGATAAAVNTLPDLGKLPESQNQIKTGTDSNSVSAACSDKPRIINQKKPESTGIMSGFGDTTKRLFECNKTAFQAKNNKAGERIRTVDVQLGKLTFYH